MNALSQTPDNEFGEAVYLSVSTYRLEGGGKISHIYAKKNLSRYIYYFFRLPQLVVVADYFLVFFCLYLVWVNIHFVSFGYIYIFLSNAKGCLC